MDKKYGWYNVEAGHPTGPHARMIVKRFLDNNLTWLGLTEIREYLPDLYSEAEKHDLKVLARREPGDPATLNQAFLVRKDVEVGKVWAIDKAGVEYHAPDGGIRRAQRPLAAILDGQVVVVIHAPVKAWVNPRWSLSGGLRRIASYRVFVSRMRKVNSFHPHQDLLLVGDWNCTPDVRGIWSPNWLRLKIKGRFIRPHARTQGAGEIDFGIFRLRPGSRIGNISCVSTPDPAGLPGSDHRMVIASYTLK